MSIRDLNHRLRRICEEQNVTRLDLFGSRARTDAEVGNDYDFVAEFPEAPPSEYAKHYFDLLHALEDELQSPIDLMNYRSIRKRSLRAAIERERIPVYER